MQTRHPTETSVNASEVAILSRLFANGSGELSKTAAQFILRLGFGDEDKARIHELAVKNQEDKLSPDERQEFESYMRVGNYVSILQSKARMALKKNRR